MATVTFTFANKTKSYTITSGSATRFSTWASAAYPTVPNPTFNVNLPVDAGTNPLTITNPEPVLSAIDALWSGIQANVKSYEQDQLKRAVTPSTDLT